MLILKQSTSIDIRMGPFVDVGDGFTPETGVTIASSDEAEVLKANGAATVAMSGTFAAVTNCDGWYDYTVQTTDVDTVGEVVFVMQDDSVYLPVYVRAQVVEEAVYDAMYGASAAGPLQSTTAGRTLDVNASGEAGLDLNNVSGTLGNANLAWVDSNNRVDVGSWLGNAVTASSGNPDVNVESLDDIDFGATMKASINTEVDSAIETYGLDHLLAAAVVGADITDDSIIAQIVSASATADWDDFDNTTDSMQATRDALTTVDTVVDGIQTDLDNGTDGLGAIKTDTAAILVDTAEIGTAGAGLTDLGGMSTSMKAEVNAEVTDNLTTDTISENAQQAPPATPTMAEAIMYLYMALRNQLDVTATLKEFHNDAGTVIWKKTLSDDGTTFSEAEGATGP